MAGLLQRTFDRHASTTQSCWFVGPPEGSGWTRHTGVPGDPRRAAGQFHVVDATLWPGLGHLWANAMLDDLERLLVPA